MDSIAIKVPITIKAKLTEKLRKRIVDELTHNIEEAGLELSQLDIEEKRVIAEQAQGDLQRLQAIRQHFGMEKQKRADFKEECEQKLADANKLAPGAEIMQGQLERQVEVKVGDNLREIMAVEILVEDDKIIAIRS